MTDGRTVGQTDGNAKALERYNTPKIFATKTSVNGKKHGNTNNNNLPVLH